MGVLKDLWAQYLIVIGLNAVLLVFAVLRGCGLISRQFWAAVVVTVLLAGTLVLYNMGVILVESLYSMLAGTR